MYVYYGSDIQKSRKKLQATVASLLKRAPHAIVETVTAETEYVDFPALLEAQGLFYAKRIVVFDSVFANAALKDAVLEILSDLAESEHIFFILERELAQPVVKKLAKYAKRIEEFGRKEPKTKDQSSFRIADALQMKDRKALWVEIEQALLRGTSAEEIHGLLFWGAKALVLAKDSDPKTSGLHPFVHSKASQRAKKFSDAELQTLISALAVLPHHSRRKGIELEYALEEFALSF